MKNEHEITMYKFQREVQAFCPLGNDYYTCNIKIKIKPQEEIFDFCEVDKKIKKLSGEKMIIEELVATVYNELEKYKPKYLKVKGKAKSNTHFDVVVEKASENERNK